MTPTSTVIDALAAMTPPRKVKAAGTGKWTAQCPAHDDRAPSLSIATGDDGRALLKCHAGCATDDVMKGMGLSMEVLRGPSQHRNGNGKVQRTIAKIYDYTDENGNLLFQKIRYVPKDFIQRRPDGKGGWVYSLGDTRRVPYRLPAIIAATPETMIYICEGEKDVDAAVESGLVATCNFDGASKDSSKPKWREEYNAFFKGRNVGIIAHKDAAGRAHAQNIAKNLSPLAAEVKVFEVPGNA
jgi:hypothetical protein